MKKIFLTFMMLVMPVLLAAQFKLTADGIQTEDGKDYIVVKVKGSQKQLFQRTKTVLTSMLKSRDYDLKYNEPDIIIVKCEGMKVAKDYLAGIKDKYSANWSVEIKFKPNRIRIDAPTLSSLKCRHSIIEIGKGSALSVNSSLNRKGHLFKDDGEIREKDMVDQINKHFDDFLGELISRVKNYETSEDNNW